MVNGAIVVPSFYATLLRISSIILFLVTSIRIDQYSIVTFLIVLFSLYFIKKKSNLKLNVLNSNKIENNLKKTKKFNLSDLPDQTVDKLKNQLLNHYLNDYSFSESLNYFNELKIQSDCSFARDANIWGAPLWNSKLTIQQNIDLVVFPSFLLFTNLCLPLKLDGFLIHLPGSQFGHDLEQFCKQFCEILCSLANLDPLNKNCMTQEIESSKWVFEFNEITFFITTFLPLYPPNHSRYTFGVNECFILFQPEISFAFHNLPQDTSVTNWTEPKTIRDKIRIKFKESNRDYVIRDTIRYPMCYEMIKPLLNSEEIVNWWKYSSLYMKKK
ncbi:Poly [ADP-ribose] polymerase 4 [Brachionus plicatilis]|uniref:Poly [ADP-ribose] polymerase 4 n=1 Tax=Brachionus plicatilis TaxID=10195 RepID=A0A3M7P695_BRAPC|nr:Poly [ADP-ribose] polymerase 4 [Brachionus plicatilis]